MKKRKHQSALAFIIIYILFYYLIILFGNHEVRLIKISGNLLSIIGALVSTLWIYQTYKSRINNQKEAVFWLQLSLGTLSYLIAELIWMNYESYRLIEVPFPSYADIFYMFQMFFYLLAFSIYYFNGKQFFKIIQFIFEILIIMVVLSTFSYYFILEQMITDPTLTGFFLFISLSYPIGDLFLFFIVLAVIFGVNGIAFKKGLIIILSGIVIQSFADSSFFYLILNDMYHAESLIDPLFTFAVLLIGYSGISAEQTVSFQTAFSFSKKINALKISFPYISSLALISYIILFDREHTVLTIGGFLSIFLVMLRQVIIILNNRQLLTHLNESKQRYQSLFDNHPDAVISLNLDGQLTSINNKFCKIMDTSSNLLIGQHLENLFSVDRDLINRHFLKTKKGLHQNFEVILKDKLRETIYIHVTYIPMYIDGTVVGVFGVFKDITELKKNTEKIHYLAYHDSLTGLHNRAFFEDSLEKEIVDSKKNGSGLAVIFIDFDRFKMINDSLGHDAGDQLLKAIADRLFSIVRKKDIIARQGGDEFTLLLKNVKNHKEIIQIMDEMMLTLNDPYHIKGHSFLTTPSIGISFYSGDHDTAVSLMKKADLAMYFSKMNGKNQYSFYQIGMEQDSANQLLIESALHHAIKNEEFVLYYQPQIESSNHKIYGLEALVRWNHPHLGMLGPGHFITIAEETNLILPIGEWVLRQACTQGKKLHDLGFEDLTISVNISPKQFQSPKLVQMVRDVIKETGFNSEFLLLEITEAVAMNHINKTIDKLKELQQIGVRISIDDFGTGHSSLSYLSNLPLNELKIPREFVNHLGVETNNAIIDTIITLAKNLKLDIIAEGVETSNQLLSLQKMGCYRMQGYYFGKPVSSKEIEELLLKNDCFLE
ncbi:EAL domain-containing protein [Litchfieldia salsa]|uniref:PAS domain S-box-containing protein/diguanylate cyclase (GGDEF) domain-containing protein n=1 Tax=Litchfieldia salsa TaxID=930152 RepID=A0A1H0THH0_9BACI|nr:EAL domain-containing protein [Litchfieldia salsa]SDP53493.1 PAS domain S-box-containing protein/diguanylate cyclase (GGDEF) domain-containing protein [Litchfieldia salsa]